MTGRWARMLADPALAAWWRALTDDRDVAVAWVEAGFSVDEAARSLTAGWSLLDAKELMAAVSGGWDVHPDEFDGHPWPGPALPRCRVLPTDARRHRDMLDDTLLAVVSQRNGGSVFSHSSIPGACCPYCDCAHGHDPLLDGFGFTCGGCCSVVTFSSLAAYQAGDR